jgi:hypothetical protein
VEVTLILLSERLLEESNAKFVAEQLSGETNAQV